MKEFLFVLRYNYANFKGRATRKEFWMFQLFFGLIFIGLFALCLASAYLSPTLGNVIGLVLCIFALATIIPYYALTARRLHDIGHSGWWQLLLYFIPFGGIGFIIIGLIDSKPGDNKYGPNPKGINLPPLSQGNEQNKNILENKQN